MWKIIRWGEKKQAVEQMVYVPSSQTCAQTHTHIYILENTQRASTKMLTPIIPEQRLKLIFTIFSLCLYMFFCLFAAVVSPPVSFLQWSLATFIIRQISSFKTRLLVYEAIKQWAHPSQSQGSWEEVLKHGLICHSWSLTPGGQKYHGQTSSWRHVHS